MVRLLVRDPEEFLSPVVDRGGLVRGLGERCTGHRRHDDDDSVGHHHDKEDVTMPQYLLSVWHDADYDLDFSTPEAQRIVAQVDKVNDELQRAGAWVFAAGLHPASSATVIRSSGGEVSMTDGPYAETKEQMGGFWIIQASDLDTALDWAGKAAAACEAPVELRPVQDG
jgi:hypothetical protein